MPVLDFAKRCPRGCCVMVGARADDLSPEEARAAHRQVYVPPPGASGAAEGARRGRRGSTALVISDGMIPVVAADPPVFRAGGIAVSALDDDALERLAEASVAAGKSPHSEDGPWQEQDPGSEQEQEQEQDSFEPSRPKKSVRVADVDAGDDPNPVQSFEEGRASFYSSRSRENMSPASSAVGSDPCSQPAGQSPASAPRFTFGGDPSSQQQPAGQSPASAPRFTFGGDPSSRQQPQGQSPNPFASSQQQPAGQSPASAPRFTFGGDPSSRQQPQGQSPNPFAPPQKQPADVFHFGAGRSSSGHPPVASPGSPSRTTQAKGGFANVELGAAASTVFAGLCTNVATPAVMADPGTHFKSPMMGHQPMIKVQLPFLVTHPVALGLHRRSPIDFSTELNFLKFLHDRIVFISRKAPDVRIKMELIYIPCLYVLVRTLARPQDFEDRSRAISGLVRFKDIVKERVRFFDDISKIPDALSKPSVLSFLDVLQEGLPYVVATLLEHTSPIREVNELAYVLQTIDTFASHASALVTVRAELDAIEQLCSTFPFADDSFVSLVHSKLVEAGHACLVVAAESACTPDRFARLHADFQTLSKRFERAQRTFVTLRNKEPWLPPGVFSKLIADTTDAMVDFAISSDFSEADPEWIELGDKHKTLCKRADVVAKLYDLIASTRRLQAREGSSLYPLHARVLQAQLALLADLEKPDGVPEDVAREHNDLIKGYNAQIESLRTRLNSCASWSQMYGFRVAYNDGSATDWVAAPVTAQDNPLGLPVAARRLPEPDLRRMATDLGYPESRVNSMSLADVARRVRKIGAPDLQPRDGDSRAVLPDEILRMIFRPLSLDFVTTHQLASTSRQFRRLVATDSYYQLCCAASIHERWMANRPGLAIAPRDGPVVFSVPGRPPLESDDAREVVYAFLALQALRKQVSNDKSLQTLIDDSVNPTRYSLLRVALRPKTYLSSLLDKSVNPVTFVSELHDIVTVKIPRARADISEQIANACAPADGQDAAEHAAELGQVQLHLETCCDFLPSLGFETPRWKSSLANILELPSAYRDALAMIRRQTARDDLGALFVKSNRPTSSLICGNVSAAQRLAKLADQFVDSELRAARTKAVQELTSQFAAVPAQCFCVVPFARFSPVCDMDAVRAAATKLEALLAFVRHDLVPPNAYPEFPKRIERALFKTSAPLLDCDSLDLIPAAVDRLMAPTGGLQDFATRVGIAMTQMDSEDAQSLSFFKALVVGDKFRPIARSWDNFIAAQRRSVSPCATKDLRRFRRIELSMALEDAGLRLREDSRLAEQYIGGFCDKSLERIVEIMAEMKFYFAHTNYSSAYHSLGRNYRSSEERSEIAKARALARFVRMQGPAYNPADDDRLPPSLVATLAREKKT